MGVTNAKDDIKTLFLTVNTLNAVGAGLWPAATSVALLITYLFRRSWFGPTVIVAYIAVAILMLGTTSLGSYAVIFEKKALLYVYMTMTVVATVSEVAVTLYFSRLFHREFFMFCIFHPSVMMTALTLAVMFSKKVSRELSPGGGGGGGGGATTAL